MNRANRVVPDSKGARNKIARNRNVSANSASVKNKAVAASKADDKKILSDQERREVTPAVFFTSKRVAKGETILLCQRKKQLNARVRMSAKASRPALRLASLCVRKWSIFGKANTAPAHRSKR